MRRKILKFGTVASALLIALVICVGLGACADPAAKYQPVKYTNDQGEEKYAWPEADEQGFIDVPGGKVSYRLYGNGKSGTPLVCLHGGPGGNYGCFYRQLPLAEERPILLYEQLGSPDTEVDASYDTADKVKSLYTIDRFTEELDSVIKFSGFNDFAFLCSSWGCMLGAEYAAKYQPAGLKGIIFAGPFLSVDTWIADAERLILSLDGGQDMLAEIRRCEQSGNYSDRFDEINSIYAKNFNNRHKSECADRPGFEEEVDGHKKVCGVDVYEYMWGKSEFSCTGTLAHHDSTPCLAKIDVPVLYMPGQYDAGTPEAAFYYCSLTKNGEVAVIPGAAHGAPSERAPECNTIITEFLHRL